MATHTQRLRIYHQQAQVRAPHQPLGRRRGRCASNLHFYFDISNNIMHENVDLEVVWNAFLTECSLVVYLTTDC